MLYCVQMDVRVPHDMDPARLEQLKADEKMRAQDLQRAGKWPHLWRVAGRYANVSVLDVADHDELHALIASLDSREARKDGADQRSATSGG